MPAPTITCRSRSAPKNCWRVCGLCCGARGRAARHPRWPKPAACGSTHKPAMRGSRAKPSILPPSSSTYSTSWCARRAAWFRATSWPRFFTSGNPRLTSARWTSTSAICGESWSAAIASRSARCAAWATVSRHPQRRRNERRGRMRTVFAKILLWSFGTLVLSLGAYLFISAGLASRISGKGGPFERTVAFQVDEAEVTYRSGGPAALGTYLRKLQAYFGPEHFLTDAQGKDLVTGADRSALLAAARGEYNVPHPLGGRFVLVVALLCWMLAVNIASPLRELAHTVERFGRGDFSARVRSRRRDEIGDVRSEEHTSELQSR